MRFKENIHRLIWGEEHWLVSARTESPSVLEDGSGRLDELRPDFPLLMKRILAKDRLSVQVHPNDETAPLTGGEAKSEMWCLLKDCSIYAGLREGVGPEDVRRAVADGSFEVLLVRHDGRAGDVFYIPGGMVHAICGDCDILEIQQSSNTTYRLYDWGRTGADGRPRKLHVDAALKTIDFSLPPPKPVRALKTPYFDFEQFGPDAEPRVLTSKGYLFAYSADAGAELFMPGETCVLPAGRAWKTATF